MNGAGLPPGLGALLGKLGIVRPGESAKTPQVAAKGLEGQPGEEKTKGAAIGPDGTALSGLGYNVEDKQTLRKNVAERENIARFLREIKDDGPLLKEDLAPKDALKDGPKEVKEAKDAKEAKEAKDQKEATEVKETKDAKGREEAKEEVKTAARQETHEERERRDQQERERHRDQQQQKKDEDEGAGSGWVMSEQEAEEAEERRRGLRDGDVMGEAHRCHGMIEDGSRCLRKPISGTPYCREHAFSIPKIDKA